MDIEYRSIEMADYPPVLSLWQSCEGIGLSSADRPEAIQAYLARNPGMSQVALAGEQVVGAVLCGHDGRRGYIHHLAVAEEWRKRDIGRNLVERCLKALTAEGIEKSHLFVYSDNNKAIAFWQRIGWISRVELDIMSIDHAVTDDGE